MIYLVILSWQPSPEPATPARQFRSRDCNLRSWFQISPEIWKRVSHDKMLGLPQTWSGMRAWNCAHNWYCPGVAFTYLSYWFTRRIWACAQGTAHALLLKKCLNGIPLSWGGWAELHTISATSSGERSELAEYHLWCCLWILSEIGKKNTLSRILDCTSHDHEPQ